MILLDNLIKDNCINHDATCSREGGVFSSAPKLLNNVHAAAAAAAPSLIMLPHLYPPDSVTYLGAAESAYSVCMWCYSVARCDHWRVGSLLGLARVRF